MKQFDYKGYEVRIVDVYGEPGPVLVDACRVLGIVNAPQAAERLDDDEKVKVGISTAYGTRDQEVWAITYTGFIKLVMASRKPEAKPFQRWVAERIKEIMQDGFSIDPILANQPTAIAMRGALEAMAQAARAELAAEKALSRIDELETRLGGPTDPYVSIAGWASINNVHLDDKSAGRVGKIAVRICKLKGIGIGGVPSERWGRVNTYPESVVAEAYDRYWNQR